MHYIEWNKLTNALYLMEQANKCVIFKWFIIRKKINLFRDNTVFISCVSFAIGEKHPDVHDT